ncbi:MAG: extracellular solute-binding protein [Chloroflexi bacterium]|nr:extracellular solute-binding protein [Chloroflexota bacterium]
MNAMCRMSKTRFLSTSGLLVTVLAALLAACAPAAAPTPVPTAPPSKPPAATAATPAVPQPTPAPKPAPVSTPVPTTSPLSQIVDAARKEGRVSLTLSSELAGKGIERLKRDIGAKYGVDLQIDYQPVGSYSARLPQAIAEYKAGATPSFDLMVSSDLLIGQAIDAGIVEKVDWKPLLAPGTAPEAIQWDGHALTTHTGHIGMIFNPNVVRSEDAPKSLGDLGDQKWKGKIMGLSAPTSYLSWAVVKGVDKTLADVRAMMKNDPVIDIYARTFTRYSTGEYPISLISSSYYGGAREKSIPVGWRSLDMSYVSVHAVLLLKRAAHPSAAKLVAAFLAGPDGHKFMVQEANSGTIFYPNNHEQDIHQQDLKAGLPVYTPQQWPGAKDFLSSDRAKQVEAEIGRILKGE